MLGTHDVRRVRRSEAEVHRPDGQVPQRQARRGRRQSCREEHHRQPGRLERELRDFAQTEENWRQKSMTLEQENEAIRQKLDKVTKELEKVKKEAAREIGNFNDAEDHKAILKAIVGNGYAHDESGRRLLRMHAAAIVEKIQATAKGDLLGQMQLAELQTSCFPTNS